MPQMSPLKLFFMQFSVSLLLPRKPEKAMPHNIKFSKKVYHSSSSGPSNMQPKPTSMAAVPSALTTIDLLAKSAAIKHDNFVEFHHL